MMVNEEEEKEDKVLKQKVLWKGEKRRNGVEDHEEANEVRNRRKHEKNKMVDVKMIGRAEEKQMRKTK